MNSRQSPEKPSEETLSWTDAASVESIYIASGGGEPMRALEEVQAMAGLGLRDDRYSRRSGRWSAVVDTCQVTLIAAEDLEYIEESFQVRVSQGQHRRNLVTRGLRLRELRGQRFQVGEAVLEYDRPRPPCAYIQSITQAGMTKALGSRAGICARVVKSGCIRPGDAITVVKQWADPI